VVKLSMAMITVIDVGKRITGGGQG